jgi:hypothetical protein
LGKMPGDLYLYLFPNITELMEKAQPFGFVGPVSTAEAARAIRTLKAVNLWALDEGSDGTGAVHVITAETPALALAAVAKLVDSLCCEDYDLAPDDAPPLLRAAAAMEPPSVWDGEEGILSCPEEMEGLPESLDEDYRWLFTRVCGETGTEKAAETNGGTAS